MKSNKAITKTEIKQRLKKNKTAFKNLMFEMNKLTISIEDAAENLEEKNPSKADDYNRISDQTHAIAHWAELAIDDIDQIYFNL